MQTSSQMSAVIGMKRKRSIFLSAEARRLVREMWSYEYDIPFSVAWNGCGLD